jgi:hypothetical protein
MLTSKAQWLGLLIAALMVASTLFFFSHTRAAERDWPVVAGAVEHAEIVLDQVHEGIGRGSQITWRAEYAVSYSVTGRQYQSRFDSGIRGASKEEASVAIPKTLPNCEVRYEPQAPEVSTADCR